MPSGVYVSKRIIATMPPSLFNLIKKLARRERRPLSQMVTALILEALVARGIEIPEEPEDEEEAEK